MKQIKSRILIRKRCQDTWIIKIVSDTIEQENQICVNEMRQIRKNPWLQNFSC